MKAKELYVRLAELIKQGHGDEDVFLDTGPDGEVFSVGEVDLDIDGVGVIIWKLLD